MLIKKSQPTGFSVFFLTEMWERYGFYVVQTLLVFYLLKKFNLSDQENYTIVGSFTALAYINSIFGGLIADKFIGSSRSIIIGGIILISGYTLLSLFYQITILYISLGLISVGTGILKPNVSSLLSILYVNSDTERKDAGYTLYYVGIYVGALGGSLLGGYIKEFFNWKITFLSAALGILIGVYIFLRGVTKFNLHDPRKLIVKKSEYIKASFGIIAMLLTSCAVLHSNFLSILYLILIFIFCFSLIICYIFKHHGLKRKRLIAFLFLVILCVCYWAIFFQQFFSISLCVERTAVLPIPVSSISSFESVGVILFGPFISYVWFYFKNKGNAINITTKFNLGFLFNMLCFSLLAIGLWYSRVQNVQLNFAFIIVAYLLLAIGELCISPTSLSMVSTLVPEKYVSVMMGISLLSIGFGGKIAGILANGAQIANQNNSLNTIKAIYMQSFFYYALISLVTLIISMLLGRYIKKLI